MHDGGASPSVPLGVESRSQDREGCPYADCQKELGEKEGDETIALAEPVQALWQQEDARDGCQNSGDEGSQEARRGVQAPEGM